MAYTKSNEIMTRISLKYDLYENWTSKNPVLLAGEVAIATIANNTSNTESTKFQNLPNVVMKVGDGSTPYNDLKFVSGLAADVYDWAKAANKPSYQLSEIANAVEYRLEAIDAATYKYQLQSRKAGSNDAWAKVSDLDLSDIDSRLDSVEGRVKVVEDDLNTAETGLKARMGKAESDINELKTASSTGVDTKIATAIKALDSSASQTAGADGLALSVSMVDGNLTAISGSIAANTYDAYGSADNAKKYADALIEQEVKDRNAAIKVETDARTAAIEALDAEKDQAAGNDGLALHIKEVDGIITEFSGSIAANTYDAHGAAKAVQGETTKTVKEAWERADAAYELADDAQTAEEVSSAIDAKIQTLDFAGVEGTQAGTTIKFVDKISQSDGIVSAELGELVFNSAYNAESNKAATMSDVTAAVADLNGAMHFEGVYETLPTDLSKFTSGDVIIVGVKEYVFSKGQFVELGDEGAIAAAIQGLDANLTQTAGNDGLALSLTQVDGVVTAISGSIAANTYDAYGSAAAAEKAANDYTDAEMLKEVAARNAAIKVETDARIAAIQGLDMPKVTVGADKTLVAIEEVDGVVSTEAIAIQIAQSQVTGLPGALESKLDASVFNTFKTDEFTPVKNAVNTLNGGVAEAGSVAYSIAAVINTLNQSEVGAASKTLKVKQENGKVTATEVDIQIAQSQVTGLPEALKALGDEDSRLAGLIGGNTEAINGINAAIGAMDADKTAAAKSVMTGVHQENGVIKSIDEVALADIAFSGNVADLKQTANEYVVFNCGTAEINI